jgi:hypothetical protein
MLDRTVPSSWFVYTRGKYLAKMLIVVTPIFNLLAPEFDI